MKTPKKITNFHDYTTIVDKIIAEKLPPQDALMKMLEIFGNVRFIDMNDGGKRGMGQVPRRSPSTARVHLSSNKHDKSVLDNQTSVCCNAKVLVASSIPDEGTRYWLCSECGRPCDVNSLSKK